MTSEAIAAVGERLRAILRDRLADEGIDRETVALGSPADLAAKATPRLGLYLYRIEPAREHTDRERRQSAPPLSLDLRYLLTAYPPSEGASGGTLGQHRLLGLAMQTLHDVSVLDVPEAVDDREVRLSLEERGPDDRAWVWETFPETPYRPSVSYHVRPVVIDSRIDRTVPEVTDRRTSVSRSE
jgi:hypothetical protein